MKYNLSVGTRAYFDSLRGAIPVEVIMIKDKYIGSQKCTVLDLRVTSGSGAYPKGFIIEAAFLIKVFPRKALTGKFKTNIAPYLWGIKA